MRGAKSDALNPQVGAGWNLLITFVLGNASTTCSVTRVCSAHLLPRLLGLQFYWVKEEQVSLYPLHAVSPCCSPPSCLSNMEP
jgi:hypothetical protein